MRINSTNVLLNLDAWKLNGCPIKHFIVKYKEKKSEDWTLYSNEMTTTENTLNISDLRPGTWYSLHVSAQTDAGSKDEDYTFATLNTYGGNIRFLVDISMTFPLEVINFEVNS